MVRAPFNWEVSINMAEFWFPDNSWYCPTRRPMYLLTSLGKPYGLVYKCGVIGLWIPPSVYLNSTFFEDPLSGAVNFLVWNAEALGGRGLVRLGGREERLRALLALGVRASMRSGDVLIPSWRHLQNGFMLSKCKFKPLPQSTQVRDQLFSVRGHTPVNKG